jgi:hypothetical protein
MPPYGTRVPAQSTNEFSPKKQQAAARNGYLIVRIRLLDVLPTYAFVLSGQLPGGRQLGSWPKTWFWEVRGTRVLCMKMTFQVPACFSRKADSNQFWLVVPDASVMLPSLV